MWCHHGADRVVSTKQLLDFKPGSGAQAKSIVACRVGSHMIGLTKRTRLTWTAFRHILATKQSNYRDVIAWLEHRVESSFVFGTRGQALMLQGIARKGDAIFAGYKY